MKTKKILCLLLTLAMVLSVSFQTMTSVFAAGQVGSEQTSLDGRISVKAVSYTHLDVYKRQGCDL